MTFLFVSTTSIIKKVVSFVRIKSFSIQEIIGYLHIPDFTLRLYTQTTQKLQEFHYWKHLKCTDKI